MRFLLAAILFTLPLQDGTAAYYDPGTTREALRISASASMRAAESLASLALKEEEIPKLLTFLDTSVERSEESSELAQTLVRSSLKPLADMLMIITGGSGASGIKEKIEKISSKEEVLRKRHDDAVDLARKIDEKISGRSEPEESGDEKDSEKALKEFASSQTSLKERLAKATDRLHAAEEELDDAKDYIGKSRNEGQRLRQRFSKAQKSAKEMSSAVERTAAGAAAAARVSKEARRRISELGNEPKSVSRTRAGEAIVPLRDAARRLYLSADTARSRADELRSRHRAFGSVENAFEDRLERAGKHLEEAESPLHDGEKILSRLKKILRK